MPLEEKGASCVPGFRVEVSVWVLGLGSRFQGLVFGSRVSTSPRLDSTLRVVHGGILDAGL